MDGDRLRDAYVDRFGALFDAAAVEEPRGHRPPFYALSFWEAEVPAAPMVYATFGAPGREVFVASVAPMFALRKALQDVAAAGTAPLAPYDLVRVAARQTPFYGFLVAPPEDGSFVVEEAGGARREVLRLIPLTRGERVFAADRDAREAYRRVREAGGLIADPLRPCTVTPQRTELWKKREGQALVRALSEHGAEVERRLAVLCERGAPAADLYYYEREAPQIRAYLRHLEATLPRLPTDDQQVAAIRGAPPDERLPRLAELLVERGLEGLEGTERWRAGLADIMSLVVHTHPQALRLVELLLGEAILPPAAEGTDAVVRACAARIVRFPGAFHRVSGHAKLESRVRRGLETARRTFVPEHEMPYESHAWACMAEALYEGVHDTSSSDGRAAATALRQAIDGSRDLELEASSDPPLAQLVAVAAHISMCMFMSYGFAAKRALDN